MKRTTYLKIMGLGWCAPQFLVMSPFVLLAITCGYLEDFFTWTRVNAEAVSGRIGNALYPPLWWPSHRYLNELNEIRSAKQKEAVDKLHNNRKEVI